MEFNEKLQELRKSRSLTQEELAEALFVSRTAVSKWESGRGYPSIDSLKEISRFFSVTIDELICPCEMVTAVENDKKEFVSKYSAMIFGLLDILVGVLLFVPVFGNGTDSHTAVTLFRLTEISALTKISFMCAVGITVLNGVCGVMISKIGNAIGNRHCMLFGMVLTSLSTAVYILTRQPYAGFFCFMILVIKGCALMRGYRRYD